MDVEWRVDPGLTAYPAAIDFMEQRVAAIRSGEAAELIWLVEHPPLYTAGTSATSDDLIEGRFPVFATGRGGRHTYHGPGQRVVYVMLDLDRRGRDIRKFIGALEDWVIATLARLGIAAFADPARVGVWTGTGNEEAKIAAIGVRVRRWVTFHGVAINVAPDLKHFGGIIPCGLVDARVTSIAAVRGPTSIDRFDVALRFTVPEFLDRVTIRPVSNVA